VFRVAICWAMNRGKRNTHDSLSRSHASLENVQLRSQNVATGHVSESVAKKLIVVGAHSAPLPRSPPPPSKFSN
jgi:hypothetical protein